MDTIYTRTQMAAKCIRSQLPSLLNDTPDIILNKIDPIPLKDSLFSSSNIIYPNTRLSAKKEIVLYATINFIILPVYKLHWYPIWYKMRRHVTPHTRHCICHRLMNTHNLHHHHHHHSSYRDHLHERDHHIDIFIFNEIYQGLGSLKHHLYEPYSGLGILFLNEFLSSPRENRESGFCLNGPPSTQLFMRIKLNVPMYFQSFLVI